MRKIKNNIYFHFIDFSSLSKMIQLTYEKRKHFTLKTFIYKKKNFFFTIIFSLLKLKKLFFLINSLRVLLTFYYNFLLNYY